MIQKLSHSFHSGMVTIDPKQFATDVDLRPFRLEHELDQPMFNLLKNLKGGLAASKWQTLGKLYGYDLKHGYIPGEDLIMDAILQDFNISYDRE